MADTSFYGSRLRKQSMQHVFYKHGVQTPNKYGEYYHLLTRKRDFLCELRRRVLEAARRAGSIREITRKVFNRRDLVDLVSQGDGWLSLLTGSDFSRGNLVRSFLREASLADVAGGFGGRG